MSGHDVTVRIDELVLVGFDQHERDVAVSALREELAGLLGGVSPRRRGLSRATVEYELGQERGPDAVGRAAARSIAHVVGARG
jgi:hypothetical protein